MLTKAMILLFLGITSNAENQTATEKFLGDIIDAWRLILPTIVLDKDIPDMCFGQGTVLCVTIDESEIETAENLARIHKSRRQDGLIFVGSQAGWQFNGMKNTLAFFQDNFDPL